MKPEFQGDIIKWLAQTTFGKKYISMIEPDLFDKTSQSTVFELMQSFYSKYNSQPSLISLSQFFVNEIKSSKSQIDAEVIRVIQEEIDTTYEEFTGNSEFIRDEIIKQYQLKLTKQLVTENLSALKDGDDGIVADLFRELSRIKALADDDEDAANQGEFALMDFVKGKRSVQEGAPTFLKRLNSMTSTKGFYPPQLIVWMGGPKSFKTGAVLNIVMNYVRDGKKVYYADCENGEGRLLDRFYQCMLYATWEEYSGGELDDVLEEMVGRFKAMGGDFIVDFYPAHTKSVNDIEDRLDQLEEEHNWKPDMIVYDYLDLMKPIDHKITEKRLKIQAVYFDAIRLQKKKKMFGFTPSQVNKESINKPVIDMTSFAEDFGKAANAHAAFAMCRTDDEKKAGVMRIVPVMQRDGEAQHAGNACFVELDEACMKMAEISYAEWKERTDAVSSKKPKREKTKKTNSGTRRPLQSVTDE